MSFLDRVLQRLILRNKNLQTLRTYNILQMKKFNWLIIGITACISLWKKYYRTTCTLTNEIVLSLPSLWVRPFGLNFILKRWAKKIKEECSLMVLYKLCLFFLSQAINDINMICCLDDRYKKFKITSARSWTFAPMTNV